MSNSPITDLTKLTKQQRADLLCQLLADTVTGHVTLPDGTGAILIRSREHVQPNVSKTVVQRTYFGLRAPRMVILEPVYDRIDRTTRTVSEKTFFKPRVEEFHEERSQVLVPRGAWRISAIYMGGDSTFPNASRTDAEYSGDAFAPGVQIVPFSNIQAGVDVTIHLSHTLSQPVPFLALLIGKRD